MLQQRHETIILKAHDRLRAALGEGEIERFDEHVQRDIADKVKPIKPPNGYPKNHGERDKK